jgi:hypothetical protein
MILLLLLLLLLMLLLLLQLLLVPVRGTTAISTWRAWIRLNATNGQQRPDESQETVRLKAAGATRQSRRQRRS